MLTDAGADPGRGRAVLVTGGAGRLGACIAGSFPDRPVVTTTRATLDITDHRAVRRLVADVRPAVIVNCAAYNDVDAAEDSPRDALAVNAFAVRTLARAADDCGATFVHYSTDFVFDGETTSAYDETARPSPRGTYGASKLLGEWFALDAARGFVCRVESLFGGTGPRPGSLDRIVDGMRAGRPVRVFTDRVASPSYVPDVAAATRYLIDRGAAPGLYHCVNTGHGTWRDLAEEAARVLGLSPSLELMTMAEARLTAPRPRFCALSNRRLTDAGYAMPTWQDAVRRWLAPGCEPLGAASRPSARQTHPAQQEP
ncbi:MAG: NAD(P)-dependent oxidoreductase [Acidimicrobiia bacterium]|nr:NAD(P)-dependent oxidoreductase [Acidimicrobiia bacterium]